MYRVNPFSDYGSIVEGQRFIGRDKEIEIIQNRILGSNYGNISIVGLPRIGKSSLVWNTLFIDKKHLINRNIFPVWISFGEYNSIYESFDEIIFQISEFISDDNLKIEVDEVTKKISKSILNVEKRRYLKRLFKYLRQQKIRILVCFDEFDNALNILNLHDFQFLRELSYNTETRLVIITISRKTIQELEPDNGALSNFYQIFTDLRLKMFSIEDYDLYWKRIENYGLFISSEYKSKIKEYCGFHPYLLDLLNNEIFNQINQSDFDLNNILTSTIEDLKLKLYNEYEAILKLIKLEGLSEKILQMIVGPVYDITQRDVEKLLKYDIVNSSDSQGYSSFASYFNDYLLLKASSINIWPLWSEVEKKVRELINEELVFTFGENWEPAYRNAFGKLDTTGETKIKKSDVLDGSHHSLGLIKERDRNRKLFGKLASNNLIDYTVPSIMFDAFISKNWNWYSQILGTQKNEWKFIFDHLGKIRNPLAHNNPNFLSDSDKNIAEGYCKNILEKIRKWNSGKIKVEES
jgi:AAA+ ATPase superfamily predicted ATPase